MIPAIVLAAGKSSRMGRPKALLPIGSSGDTFLTHILHVLRSGGIARAVVVIGGDAGRFSAFIPGWGHMSTPILRPIVGASMISVDPCADGRCKL